jgi:hypothetical protein
MTAGIAVIELGVLIGKGGAVLELVRFYLEALAESAAVIRTAGVVAFVAGITLAVCGGIPYAIVWAVYSVARELTTLHT